MWFNHRKCLLLTHSATLFSIFEADVRAADLRATGRFLTHLIGREVLKLRPATQDVRRPGAGKVILAKTADRSVLGCMNDMAFLCEKAISGSGGLSCTDVVTLNRSLRRNINSAHGYQPPIALTVRDPHSTSARPPAA